MLLAVGCTSVINMSAVISSLCCPPRPLPSYQKVSLEQGVAAHTSQSHYPWELLWKPQGEACLGSGACRLEGRATALVQQEDHPPLGLHWCSFLLLMASACPTPRCKAVGQQEDPGQPAKNGWPVCSRQRGDRGVWLYKRSDLALGFAQT